jgi:hypothetical protein
MNKITDIWFRTDLDLRVLGDKLNLLKIDEDAENFWEWIIGTFQGVRIDISREHTVPSVSTDTRIFIIEGNNEFEMKILSALVNHLHLLNITPVYLGYWVLLSGKKFKKKVLEIKKKEI